MTHKCQAETGNHGAPRNAGKTLHEQHQSFMDMWQRIGVEPGEPLICLGMDPRATDGRSVKERLKPGMGAEEKEEEEEEEEEEGERGLFVCSPGNYPSAGPSVPSSAPSAPPSIPTSSPSSPSPPPFAPARPPIPAGTPLLSVPLRATLWVPLHATSAGGGGGGGGSGSPVQRLAIALLQAVCGEGEGGVGGGEREGGRGVVGKEAGGEKAMQGGEGREKEEQQWEEGAAGSIWRQYAEELLPREIETLADWSEEELEHLQSPPAAAEVRGYAAEMAAMEAAVSAAVPGAARERARWALRIVTSRSFSISNAADPAGAAAGAASAPGAASATDAAEPAVLAHPAEPAKAGGAAEFRGAAVDTLLRDGDRGGGSGEQLPSAFQTLADWSEEELEHLQSPPAAAEVRGYAAEMAAMEAAVSAAVPGAGRERARWALRIVTSRSFSISNAADPAGAAAGAASAPGATSATDAAEPAVLAHPAEPAKAGGAAEFRGATVDTPLRDGDRGGGSGEKLPSAFQVCASLAILCASVRLVGDGMHGRLCAAELLSPPSLSSSLAPQHHPIPSFFPPSPSPVFSPLSPSFPTPGAGAAGGHGPSSLQDIPIPHRVLSPPLSSPLLSSPLLSSPLLSSPHLSSPLLSSPLLSSPLLSSPLLSSPLCSTPTCWWTWPTTPAARPHIHMQLCSRLTLPLPPCSSIHAPCASCPILSSHSQVVLVPLVDMANHACIAAMPPIHTHPCSRLTPVLSLLFQPRQVLVPLVDMANHACSAATDSHASVQPSATWRIRRGRTQ
ncbi:unnamed protein product, partial [Closterium sp. NIES-54]